MVVRTPRGQFEDGRSTAGQRITSSESGDTEEYCIASVEMRCGIAIAPGANMATSKTKVVRSISEDPPYMLRVMAHNIRLPDHIGHWTAPRHVTALRKGHAGDHGKLVAQLFPLTSSEYSTILVPSS